MAGPGDVPGTSGDATHQAGRLFVGTSGFSYPDWAPRFYPPGIKSKDLLAAYGERLSCCELNNTFYRHPSETAITEGLKFPFVAVGTIVTGLWSLITGEVPGGLLGPSGLTGPIGIADVAVQSVNQGPLTYLFLVALLSVALGFTNLLPLLALDGGRIVVVIIEWLRRRPFDRTAEMNFQRWGLVALIALAAVISFLDIQRLATGQFLGIK